VPLECVVLQASSMINRYKLIVSIREVVALLRGINSADPAIEAQTPC
jgi:hypothetical protein